MMMAAMPMPTSPGADTSATSQGVSAMHSEQEGCGSGGIGGLGGATAWDDATIASSGFVSCSGRSFYMHIGSMHSR